MIAIVFHDNRGQIVCVVQLAHGGIGNVEVLVDIVVPILYLMLEYADDLIRDAIKSDAFSQSVLAREKFFLRVGANDSDAIMSKVIRLAEETALGNFHAAHVPVRGINSADAIGSAARAVGGETLLRHFGRDPLQQRHFSTNVVKVIDRQANLRSSLCASSLQFGAAGENEYEVGSEGAECRP